MPITRRHALAGLGATAALAAARPSLAAYPDRVIKIVVPFPAGGPTDIIGRAAGQAISEGLGQPAILDNRAGASGNIGADLVAKSAPDGYTLLMGNIATHAINSHVFKSMAFDPIADFTPICALISPRMCLAAHPSMPFTSVAGLIEHARRHPKELAYASSGLATPHHLAGALLCRMAGIDMIHVPYRGAVPAATDVVSGQVQTGFISLATALPFQRAGRLRILGMTEKTRTPLLPDVPSIAETVPDFEMTNWQGLFGPARLPRGIVDALYAQCAKGFSTPAVKTSMENQGLGVILDTPDEFAGFVRREDRKWGQFVKSMNLVLE